MFRIVALALIASAQASRIALHGREFKSQSKFGASCDDLQTVFHNKVVAFKSLLDANPDLDEIGRVAQGRIMMRTYGIIRTLRRARTCSWVVENDNDDIEQAREIVQTLLVENPCQDAARSELATGASDDATSEVELRSIYRAMSILASDNCEVRESVEQTDSEATPDEEALDDESAVDVGLSETEAEVQDAIDEFVDSSHEGEGAFIQTKSNGGNFGGFMRAVGVAFWMLLLLLACASTVALIGFFIGFAFTMLLAVVSMEWRLYFRWCFRCVPGMSSWHGVSTSAFLIGVFGAMGSGAVGIGPCSYALYNQLLPGQ